MMANVPNTTNTIGSIADSRTAFNGQQNTRMYNDNEKADPMRARTQYNKVAAGWSSNQLDGILGIGSTTPESKLPESED